MKEKVLYEIYHACILNHWSEARFKASGYFREVQNNWHRNLRDVFGGLPISKITVDRIRKWHKSLSKTPIDGNRAKAVLSKLFSYAQEMGWWNGGNPCAVIPNHREKKRSRFATDQEITRIGKELEEKAEKFPREVAFIYLLIFTGARPRSIERARPQDLERIEVDCQIFGLLNFEGKTGDEQVVIPPQAMRLLDKILPSETLLGIKFPRVFWNTVRKDAGCENLWARDWRRTFASLGLSSGVTLGQIGEILNHKNNQTTMRYAKLIPAAKISAVSQISEQMSKRLKVGG